MKWDVFISYASEDKEEIAMPLAHGLQARGFKVWIDALQIKLGQSLRETIDEAIANSAYAVIILSPHYFSKQWTSNELNALFAKDESRSSILPIWHNVSKGDIASQCPLLLDRLAASTENGLEFIFDKIVDAVAHSNLVQEYKELEEKRKFYQDDIEATQAKFVAQVKEIKLQAEQGEIDDDELNYQIGWWDDEYGNAEIGSAMHLADIEKRLNEIEKVIAPLAVDEET